MKFALNRNYVIWLLSAIIVIFAFMFVQQRGQDQNWDLLNYHYFAGYSFLHGRFLYDIAPVNLQSFLNPVANILAYLPLAHLSFPTSAWVILVVQLLSLPILVLIARLIGRELGYPQFGVAEFLALALCLLAPLWWSELGTTFFSSATAPMVLLGLYLGLRGFTQKDNSNNIFIYAGLLFGFSAGLKLTNAPFAMAFFFALLVVSTKYQRQHAFKQLLKLSIGMAGGFLLTAWWNIYLLQNWGSPLFPLYNAWFKSPFFDHINFRDIRWQFTSITDFFQYVWAATTGTAKTSEVVFADARLLILLALLPIALFVRKNDESKGKGVLLFVLFFGVSFFLWGIMLAYQRYLIPIEVLFGFGIWILLTSVTSNRRLIALVLAGCVIASALLIKVPDWGHSSSRSVQSNAFGLELPLKYSTSPARYLVIGNPIGFVLPFLHPNSRFYGLGFSSHVDRMIRSIVTQDDALPLRLLTNQANILSIWDTLSLHGFTPDQNNLTCSHFRSFVDSYMICDITRRTTVGANTFPPVEMNFQSSSKVLPSTILGFKGLSIQEPWGRWTDGDEVEIKLANCLPMGKLRIDLRGHAFGPNIRKPTVISLGTSKSSVVFTENDSDQSVILENNEQCQRKLSILVPKKTSPLELGISEDARPLGIGFVSLNIFELKQ